MSSWTSLDEKALQDMLARKGRNDAIVYRFVPAEITETRMLMIEDVLNQKLRPDQFPKLKYCRTQRLTLQLMSALELTPHYHSTFVTVSASVNGEQIVKSSGFSGEQNKVKALMAAVAECAMYVILTKEEQHGASTPNLAV